VFLPPLEPLITEDIMVNSNVSCNLSTVLFAYYTLSIFHLPHVPLRHAYRWVTSAFLPLLVLVSQPIMEQLYLTILLNLRTIGLSMTKHTGNLNLMTDLTYKADPSRTEMGQLLISRNILYTRTCNLMHGSQL
jgi:hypothetical protein